MTRASPSLRIRALAEDRPGPRWAALFDEFRTGYERWYLSEGDAARPSYLDCEEAMESFLPELVPAWRALCELAGGGDVPARLLSLYRPPAYITGCSQAVWSGDEVLLVRNYDYLPQLCDGVMLRSRWTRRPVVAMTDCMIGVLDGMNGDGLCVSINFGGRPEVGDGFGAPIVARYLLECCSTTVQAIDVLRRVPTHMAYNILVLDRSGHFVTAFTRAGGGVELRRVPVSTNHQGRITWPDHARASDTLKRERHLYDCLSDVGQSADAFVEEFLRPPLLGRDHRRGFGTLYTAVYRPKALVAELRWPGRTWTLPMRDFPDGEHTVRLGGTQAGTER